MSKEIYYVNPIAHAMKWYGEISEDYVSNPEKYVRKFSVVINGKLRHLVTYNPNRDGQRLRSLHMAVTDYIKRKYNQANSSYAYTVGKNILNCVNEHIKAEAFLKTDIHRYFDSISYEKMLSRVFELKPSNNFKKYLKSIIKACFYDDKLPIGFVSSPVLSDLFLVDLDKKFEKKKNITYTRYADDFIISVNNLDSEPLLNQVKLELEADLSDLGLELNTKKTYIRRFKFNGDAIHVLGVNIVKDSPTNRITISDRYIRETCRMISDYINSPQEMKEINLPKVSGRIEFVRYCSKSSFQKLYKMTRVKCGIDCDLTAKSLKKI